MAMRQAKPSALLPSIWRSATGMSWPTRASSDWATSRACCTLWSWSRRVSPPERIPRETAKAIATMARATSTSTRVKPLSGAMVFLRRSVMARHPPGQPFDGDPGREFLMLETDRPAAGGAIGIEADPGRGIVGEDIGGGEGDAGHHRGQLVGIGGARGPVEPLSGIEQELGRDLPADRELMQPPEGGGQLIRCAAQPYARQAGEDGRQGDDHHRGENAEDDEKLDQGEARSRGGGRARPYHATVIHPGGAYRISSSRRSMSRRRDMLRHCRSLAAGCARHLRIETGAPIGGHGAAVEQK